MTQVSDELTKYPMDMEDPEEMYRLIQQAKLFTQYIGLYPLQIQLTAGQRVLDIGCGPGQWVLDMARANPQCEILGLDLSQRIVKYANSAAQVFQIPNAHFVLGDACQALPYPDQSFDLIHARFITPFQTTRTWPIFLAEVYRLLRPGGVVCSTETENFGITTSASLARYSLLVTSNYRKRQQCFTTEGSEVGITAVQQRLLRESGFVDIQQQIAVMNFSAGTPAHFRTVTNVGTAMILLQPVLVREKLIEQNELELLHASALAEMHRDDFNAILLFQTAWGKRPESAV